MTFNGVVRNGAVSIHASRLYERTLRSLEGQEVVLSVRKKRVQRSLLQNRYYWFCLGFMEEETGNDKDALHAFFKGMFLSEPKDIAIGNAHVAVAVTPSTTRLTTRAFTHYVEQIVRWCAEQGYVLPSPDDAASVQFDVSSLHSF